MAAEICTCIKCVLTLNMSDEMLDYMNIYWKRKCKYTWSLWKHCELFVRCNPWKLY